MKRANPFVEDFVPQSKMHVGLKQFNNNEEKLKTIYEKTLALLYQGSKILPVQKVNNSCDTVCETRKDRMKQLFIAKDGSLLHSGNVCHKKSSTAPCTCGELAPESQCAYCERALCAVCQHHCVHCQQVYCSQCSLVGSDGSEVCVSCYS